MSNDMTPVEALENAVAHHKVDMAPSLVARHMTLTLLRRLATVAVGVAVLVGGVVVNAHLMPSSCLANGATVVIWLGGITLLDRATRVARRLIARSTLRSFESMQGIGALGAGGASVGVSALLTPAQKMLQQRERAEAEKLELQRARREARERARGGDSEARDFDDAD
jgi:hypothetical protein